MNDIKLFIGQNEYLNSKLPWLPTIDSVLSTQIYVTPNSNRSTDRAIQAYQYRTIIIFRKPTQDNYNYPMEIDMLYTNSNTDYLTQHLGTDEQIVMDGNYDYFDGTYYYSYLVMYSNTFNQWNVVNDTTVYAVLYDQQSVTLNGGAAYIMNEHRITKNVEELIVDGVITNIETLILPNKTSINTNFGTYSSVTSCKKYRLYDEVNTVTGQQVNTLNGLLYNLDYTTLLAVPYNYQLDLNNDLILPNYVTTIKSYAFSVDIDNRYLNVINILRGDSIMYVEDESLMFINLTTLYLPQLKSLGYASLLGSTIEQLYLPNTLDLIQDTATQDCLELTRVYLQYNIKGLIDLRGAYNIDAAILSVQLFNVGDLTLLPTNYIYLPAVVYDACAADSIKFAEDYNWTVVRL